MGDLQIVALYAALNVMIALGLSIRVGMVRSKTGIALGDGADMVLQRAMRTHANNVEYVPFVLILLVLLALLQAPSLLLHGLGIGLTFARITHAFALNRDGGMTAGRTIGASLTMLVMLVEIVTLLLKVLGR
jgi:uncharacterized membrane protein YecN with MAPEG domain